MQKFTVQNRYIRSDGRRMRLLILLPKERPKDGSPGVLWVHGGGYATGMPEMAFFSRPRDLVEKFGAVVVSPDYRLSWKEPYPAQLKDCYRALLYMKRHAEELGIRSDQLMVGGESAGGGMTVSLCLYARDHDHVNIAYQMPLYPMLDNHDTSTSTNNTAPVWNTKRNHAAWKMYLKNVKGEPSYYAAPARCKDYHGLPPAYTFVGSIEPFYEETLTYINRLKDAGIEAEADVYEGCWHAFDMLAPFKKESKEAIRRFDEHFVYAMKNYFAENEMT